MTVTVFSQFRNLTSVRRLVVATVLLVLALVLTACHWSPAEASSDTELEITIPSSGLRAMENGRSDDFLFLYVVERNFLMTEEDSEFTDEELGISEEELFAFFFGLTDILRGDFPGGAGGFAWITGRNLQPGAAESLVFRDLRGGDRYIAYAFHITPGDGEDFPDIVRADATAITLESGSRSSVSLDLVTDAEVAFNNVFSEEVGIVGAYQLFLPEVIDTDANVFYAGTGSATIYIEAEDRTWSLDYGLVRIDSFDSEELTTHILQFYEDGEALSEFQDTLWIALLDDSGTDEPSRPDYVWPSDPEELFPGEIEWAEFYFGFDGQAESATVYGIDYTSDTEPELSSAGFIGGGPSNNGTFSLVIEGLEYIEGQQMIIDLEFAFEGRTLP